MKKELEQRLAELNWEWMSNECRDRGYDFELARELNAEIAKVKKELAELS